MAGEKGHNTHGSKRDHGGGLDAACERWGGARTDWLDLSTGINPIPYPLPELPGDAWSALPDSNSLARLITAARAYWDVPAGLEVLPTHGASAPIARIPFLLAPHGPGRVHIPAPTYNEHAAAFRNAGFDTVPRIDDGPVDATVLVHPNNPDGRLWTAEELPESGLLIIDESFCDIHPERSLLPVVATRPQTLVLKSFGKFWGLAGLRLGFVIGAPALIAPLREMTGPWSVSGPALAIGEAALTDNNWARETRTRLDTDAARLDTLMTAVGATLAGGTSLFRLYRTADATAMQERLARGHVWSRRFPYSSEWIRLGLPGSESDWQQLERALA
ncbi:threonine-phosphate decarboxylase CobD [Aliiruegeria sabulilitoris]|uniref:threonine-phosphate decarboxylase CobD n=1 Tax=Aliiruegeria sabulilitoris TaxID=1510458 RepID=UPI000833261F|nr:threonine-phosphate decarboxylase CobD [Aliiruegeria sabulilitoris]NDR56866.1 threonine-phosphate decarboxylase [Pseudoruegeria sp. M32A2M]